MAELGEGGVGCSEVGGVVERRLTGERVGRVGGRREHSGGVGFDEEAVEGNVLVEFAQTAVAGSEVGGVEGKIGAEGGEGRDQFVGAAVGVEEKTAAEEGDGSERFQEQAEGVDAVDRDGAVERGGEVELGLEDGELFVEGRAAEAGKAGIVGAGAVYHPAVEADLTDGGARVRGKAGAEGIEPRGRAVADVPRVEAVARKQLKVER